MSINNNLDLLKNKIKEIDLQNDFLNLSRDELYEKFSINKIVNLFDFVTEKEQYNERLLIFGAYFIIEYIFDEFIRSDEIKKDLFEYVARFLELSLKYSSMFSQKLQRYRQTLLLISICYDLADKIANAKVIIEKLKKEREEDIQPLDYWNNLNYNIINIIISYLLRKPEDLALNVQNCIDLGSGFNDFVEEKPEKFNTVLGIFQLLKSFEYISKFWNNGDLNSLNLSFEFIKKSKTNFDQGREYNLLFISDLLNISFFQEKKRSIYNLPNGNVIWEAYKKQLLFREIVELWPSQLEAINHNILEDLDFVVSAPTSSGKSFIAEICIIDSLSTKNDSKIIYIVPSRALASQVYFDLSKSLKPLGFNVGILVGGISFPKLDNFMLKNSSVIIFTLEKFQILYDQKNNFLQNISLLIIDEAHNIGMNTRGLNLEVLLTNLKKDNNRPKKILMLSAVTPNPDEIVDWININNGGYIRSTWSPTRSNYVLFTLDGELKFYGDLNGFIINIMNLKNKSAKEKAIFLAKKFYENSGQTLVFNTSPKKAEEYSDFFFRSFKNKPVINKSTANKIRYIMGKNSKLAEYIEKGVAYHHAGIPPTVRELIEKLVKNEKLKIITATTTLAEGINSPVTNIIIPSMWLTDHYLSKMEFKNLAGRAGRALRSTEGFVVLIETEKFSEENAESYISSNINNIEDVNSFLETILENNYILEKVPKNYYQKLLYNNAYLATLSLQKEILSALIKRTFNGYSLDNFLKFTYFGHRRENNKIKKSKYVSVKMLLKEALEKSEKLEIPTIEKKSPYKPTNFGYICNKVGLLPSTMNNIVIKLKSYINNKVITETLISTEFFSKNIEGELLKLFEIFQFADEVKYSSKSKIFLRKDFPEIILSWLKAKSIKEINKKYFNNFSDTVIFCEQFIKNYCNWISYGIYVILKDYFKYNVSSFLENLPFFLTYGTLSPINGILQALKISPRTYVLEKITYHIVKKYPELNTFDFENIIKNLIKTRFSDFIYPGISKFELKELNSIIESFDNLKEYNL